MHKKILISGGAGKFARELIIHGSGMFDISGPFKKSRYERYQQPKANCIAHIIKI